jgi:hypothetical protein
MAPAIEHFAIREAGPKLESNGEAPARTTSIELKDMTELQVGSSVSWMSITGRLGEEWVVYEDFRPALTVLVGDQQVTVTVRRWTRIQGVRDGSPSRAERNHRRGYAWGGDEHGY